MGEFNENIQKYSMQKEAELQQKIRCLEGDMLKLFNKLLLEKQKLDESMAKQYVPIENNDNNQAIDSKPTTGHLPQCPNSNTQMILKIDPNCRLHGHIYSRKSNIRPHHMNSHSVLSMYNMNSMPDEDKNFAGGDISQPDNNSINLTPVCSSGDQKSSNTHFYCENNQITQINTDHLQIDGKTNHPLGPSTQRNIEKSECQIQMSSTGNLRNDAAVIKSVQDTTDIITNQIPTNMNENLFKMQNVSNIKTNSQVNFCKIFEISDHRKYSLDPMFDSCINQLDNSIVDQDELEEFLDTLNIADMSSKEEEEKHEDMIAQILQSMIS